MTDLRIGISKRFPSFCINICTCTCTALSLISVSDAEQKEGMDFEFA